jgi:hypothetical protein
MRIIKTNLTPFIGNIEERINNKVIRETIIDNE